MATALDMLLSMVLGGLLLMIIMNSDDIAMQNSAVHKGDQLVQESAVSLSLYVDGDLRNMGFGVPDSGKIVLEATPLSITYYTDLPPFGSVDKVRYYVGDSTELASTPNVHDRFLYRQENGNPPVKVGVVTSFTFQYYDRNSQLMTFPIPAAKLSQIMRVETTTEIQDPFALYGYDSSATGGPLYSRMFWTQSRLAAQNFQVAGKSPTPKPPKPKPPKPPTPRPPNPNPPPPPSPPPPKPKVAPPPPPPPKANLN